MAEPGKITTTAKRKAVRPARARARAGTDRRRERGEIKVRQMIDAAIDLIAEEGIASATMQRVAQQVQATSALVVFHFKNMENLFKAVLDHLSEEYDAIWVELVRSPNLSPAERLLGAIHCARRFARQHPKWVSVFIAFSGDRASMRLYRKIALPGDQAYMDEARGLIGEIARQGGYRNVDLDSLCEGLNYLVYGAWLWDHLNPRRPRSDTLHKNAMLLLHQAFPKDFPIEG